MIVKKTKKKQKKIFSEKKKKSLITEKNILKTLNSYTAHRDELAVLLDKEMGKFLYIYDVAQHLRTSEEMAEYLQASIEEGDAVFIEKALEDIARAKGLKQTEKELGKHILSFVKILKKFNLKVDIKPI